jgi:enoyl-CoA hydratase/carnithine racemase
VSYDHLLCECAGAVTTVTIEAKTLAAALASKAPVALQQAKAAINVGADIDLDDGCRYEAEAFAVALATADRVEGMRSFLEKRPGVFKGS